MVRSRITKSITDKKVKIKVERLKKFAGLDLSDLCDAALDTIKDTYSFSLGNSLTDVTDRETLERYFQGVLLIQERELLVARLDGTIANSVQIFKPPKTNRTSDFMVKIETHFVAPWARGHGLARALLIAAEDYAKAQGYTVITLSTRSTRAAAISLYETSGYVKWGVLPKYERSGDMIVSGNFYYKDIGE
jgi:ribosomal protein S18 acetylase RimI-like enzyme